MTQNGDWRPVASADVLRARAHLLGAVRDYFARSGVLEVETPALSRTGVTDPHLTSFQVSGSTGSPRYLHTSPEFAMKRLLAAGSGSIYQICHVFRSGEQGRLHHSEFTLIEWYRVGYDHWQLMVDVSALLHRLLAGRPLGPPEYLSYAEAFTRYTGLDPHTTPSQVFAEYAQTHGIHLECNAGGADLDFWRDLLLSHEIEPHLGRGHLTFLYDYPASQAALAKVRPGPPPVAERFEVYVDGIELGNGFHELGNAQELGERFAAEQARREQQGLAPMAVDQALLAALDHGLPACAGVALGFDRVVMLATGQNHIRDVLTFPET